MLLEKDVTRYTAGFLISSMPRTFQEAIEVCRSLDIKYLWIDSLCIIQDSAEDWLSEAVRMADIYSNAYINLAGTASETSDTGLFRLLDPYLVHSLEVSTKGRWTQRVHWRLKQKRVTSISWRKGLESKGVGSAGANTFEADLAFRS